MILQDLTTPQKIVQLLLRFYLEWIDLKRRTIFCLARLDRMPLDLPLGMAADRSGHLQGSIGQMLQTHPIESA